MPQDTWDARLARAVGENVQRFRKDQREPLSALALSEITRTLGHPLHRSVIAKLEAGLRASVSVGDILVLARALNVPPLALVAPLDLPLPVEVLPGVERTPWEALDWFEGEWNAQPGSADPLDTAAWGRSTFAFDMRRGYLIAVAVWRNALDAAGRNPGPTSTELVHARREAVEYFRARLEEAGVEVPPLPEDTRG